MKRDKRGAVILEQRPRKPTTSCACCHGEANGARFCERCVENHGTKQAGHKQDKAWTSNCPYAQAFSEAYAERIRNMPSQAPGNPDLVDKNIALEPMWTRRNGVLKD